MTSMLGATGVLEVSGALENAGALEASGALEAANGSTGSSLIGDPPSLDEFSNGSLAGSSSDVSSFSTTGDCV